MHKTMSFTHILLALLVVVIWSENFIFIKLSLDEFSPLFLCALRFLLSSIPAIFFIKIPKEQFGTVVLYGLVMFALQFACLFVSMHVGMTSGMAAVIMQTQVFFSIFFAASIFGEKPSIWQIIGALVSFIGIGLVALHFDRDISILGFIFVLISAAAWGVGNMITKKLNGVSMIALIVWGCFIACVPMLILTVIFEGFTSMFYSLHHVTWKGSTSLFYTVCMSTWIGYSTWNYLISKYPINMVVPFTLLVPIVGVLSSVLLMGEPFQLWKLVSLILVMAGLYINFLGPRLYLFVQTVFSNEKFLTNLSLKNKSGPM